MYAGKVVESGGVHAIFEAPFHPYTLGLKNAFPSVKGPKQTLISIPGYPPSLIAPSLGCRFVERCPFAIAECGVTEPPLVRVDDDHYVACIRLDDVQMIREQAGRSDTWRCIVRA